MSKTDDKENIVPMLVCTNDEGAIINPDYIKNGLGYWKENSIHTSGIVDQISLNGQEWYTMEEVKEALELKKKFESLTPSMVEQFQRHDHRKMFNIFKMIGGIDDQ